MPTLSEIFDKRKILLYQNESLDLDHYYQEPYQDEHDEIKDMGKPFETDESKKIRILDLANEDRTYSGFSHFMDGSRRTYKIGDMVLEGKKIFPVVVAQVRAGCTERDRQRKLHTHNSVQRKNLLLLSDKMNMFAGEIHALHTDLIPNSQRDDFEPNAIYGELRQALGKWAGEINKKYRRGMSEATSALRRLNQLNTAQKELEDKIDSGAITSDEKREQFAEQLKQIAKKREAEEKTVRKAQERGTFDVDRKETIEKVLAQTETASKKMTSLNKKVVNADYATKHDLPSSYSRDERKLYQRIITVIDTYFAEDPKTAEKLREAIKSELSVKKK